MRKVTCTTCDPPSTCLIPDDWVIEEPYICTVCIKRVLRWVVLASKSPQARRLQHGTALTTIIEENL